MYEPYATFLGSNPVRKKQKLRTRGDALGSSGCDSSGLVLVRLQEIPSG